MINLIILSFSTLGAVYTSIVIYKTKEDSLENKSLFISEYKNSELHTHEYHKRNYKNVRKWIESKYPLLDYINKQDLQYSQCIFREDKDSIKYKTAILGKYDMAKLKKEIEFDTLRECFTQICKSDSNCKSKQFLYRNKNLIHLFTQNILFTKKIVTYSRVNHLCIACLLISSTLFFIT